MCQVCEAIPGAFDKLAKVPPIPIPALDSHHRALDAEVRRVSSEGGGTVHLVLHVGPSLNQVVRGQIRITRKIRAR